MQKQFLTIILILYTLLATAQDTTLSKLNSARKGYNDCMYRQSDKFTESTYPFNKATRIEVISYASRPHIPKSVSTDSLIQMGVFIVTNPVDRIILNKSQTDSLFSILYNYKPVDPGGSSTDCYEPRHAIVFYQNSRAIAFIEICFECSRTIRTHGIDFGLFCSDKYSMLRNFFRFIGIQHVSGSSFPNSGKGIEK